MSQQAMYEPWKSKKEAEIRANSSNCKARKQVF
jgi:hypothetical protein